jgi:hypothetical protein
MLLDVDHVAIFYYFVCAFLGIVLFLEDNADALGKISIISANACLPVSDV